MSRVAAQAARAEAVKTAPRSMPGGAQNGRVDRQDIRHGDKGGQAGEALPADRGAVLLQMKEPVGKYRFHTNTSQ